MSLFCYLIISIVASNSERPEWQIFRIIQLIIDGVNKIEKHLIVSLSFSGNITR